MNDPNNISWESKVGNAQWGDPLYGSPSSESSPKFSASRYSSCSSDSDGFVPPPPPSDDSDNCTSEDDSSCTSNKQVSPIASGHSQEVAASDDNESGHFPSSKSSDSNKRRLDESNFHNNNPVSADQASSMASDSSRRDYNERCSVRCQQPARPSSDVEGVRDDIGIAETISSCSVTSNQNHKGSNFNFNETVDGSFVSSNSTVASNILPSSQTVTKSPVQTAISTIREHSNRTCKDRQLIDDLIDLLPTDPSQLTPTKSSCAGSPSFLPSSSSKEGQSQFSSSYEESSTDSFRGFQRRDPPADESSYDSYESEHDQWLFREKLSSLMGVVETYALRCAFDDWKCIAAIQSRRMRLERHSKSFNVMELIGQKISMRLVLSTLKSKVQQRKNQHAALDVLCIVTFRALLRVAFHSWLRKQKEYLAICCAVHSHIAKIGVRLMQQCLTQWKIYTSKSILRRQECFLMMLFNRWRLWVEDQIEEREKEHIALFYWATSLHSKAFRSLREHVRQSRESRRKSFACPGRFISPPAKTTPNYLKTWGGSAPMPLGSSYRSPQKSTAFHRTPNLFSGSSAARNSFPNVRRQSYLGEMPGASLPYQNLPAFDLQQTWSKDSNRIFDTTLTRNSRSDIDDSFSPFRDMLLSLNTRSNAQSKLSHKFVGKGDSAYNTSFSAPIYHATDTARTRVSFSSGSNLYSMPSPSVRGTKTLFKEKYEIASLLDEMVSIVQQRFKMCYQQPSRTYPRYAGYAGCNEELYRRL